MRQYTILIEKGEIYNKNRWITPASNTLPLISFYSSHMNFEFPSLQGCLLLLFIHSYILIPLKMCLME